MREMPVRSTVVVVVAEDAVPAAMYGAVPAGLAQVPGPVRLMKRFNASICAVFFH
jgi:hypothetical protein